MRVCNTGSLPRNDPRNHASRVATTNCTVCHTAVRPRLRGVIRLTGDCKLTTSLSNLGFWLVAHCGSDTLAQVMNPGDLNHNSQRVLRFTHAPGTDHDSKIWVLRCGQCNHIYGCNSTDAWERKCPQCQQGRPGLEVPVEREGEKWSREEHIIAFNLYNQIPFGTIHMRNPKVIELAALLGRSVGSVSYKLSNFARLDPALQGRGIRGMSHGAKGEKDVWREFVEHPEALAFESARLIGQQTGQSIERSAEIDDAELPPPGVEREAIVRLRVNQSFFRRRVLSAYGYRCCVTGLTVPELLVASHIVPWAEDPLNRLNVRNGLCLNALHDRAFDRGLMWIESGFIIRFEAGLSGVRGIQDGTLKWLTSFAGKSLQFSGDFLPDPTLLHRHAEKAETARKFFGGEKD